MTEQLQVTATALRGRSMVESGRWHDGRWWFADWGTGEVVALDTDGGTTSVTSRQPPGRMGWSVEWLPDGRLLTTGTEVTRYEPDGTPSTFCERGGNEIVVDPAGHVYIDGADFDFAGGGQPEPGWIELVEPDGRHRRVAEDIQFPNGMVITPDGRTLVVAESFAGQLTAFTIETDGTLTGRRVWADGLGPDGICIDAEGGIWAQTADTFAHTGAPGSPPGACVRILDGGEITHRIDTPLPCFSTALGGLGGRQLLLLCNEFDGVDKLKEVQARRSATLLLTEAPVPRAEPGVVT